MYYGETVLFCTKDLFSYIGFRKENIRDSIQKEKEEYILNVGQEQYIDHLYDKNKISTINILENEIYGDEKEEAISAENFPRHFNVYSGKSYQKPVLYYTIPFEGDKEMLYYRPSSFYSIFPSAYITDNKIVKRYVVFSDNYQECEREFHNFKGNIIDYVRNLNSDIESYNSNIRSLITSIFESRKAELLKRRELKSGLTIPIRKKGDMPKTFSIPSVQVKKKITMKPVETESNFVPDPTLDDKTYNDILKIINDMGKEFERKPAVYGNKGEEALRDHFLVLLEPHFDGSATGETFNKSGKTDILLRYEGENVFVGECKFWTGEKGFLQTIDQLLGYLTWRDSKTSVIMFVRNKDITSVIETAKESIQKHENFIKFVDEKDGSWFNYIFHLNGDKNKEIKVAVMFYHTPKDE
ncbi:hypothetical protein [Lysinibacillus sp. Bpr_S20]|uniref:hypothetical protein n=1 Tax=Lysinibacillus sp. Bpr_S20 TaxID=2933964 RepID=UPI0020130D5F|nr:hypothetical protein [Lysinibacillus sp. Bpr_S20]MCL1700797.1 hypothetical protein [Lysinibacillus sp. Bpr_S20]